MNMKMLNSIGRRVLRVLGTGTIDDAINIPKTSEEVRTWEGLLGVSQDRFKVQLYDLAMEAAKAQLLYKKRQARKLARRRSRNGGSLAKKQAKSAAGVARRKALPGWLHNRANHLGRKAVRAKGVA